ncbi:MAG TPA: hypothetical protein VM925_37950, partial [Labilithrix sp.]|nr:hypothetical protein [Labilithrix sp.]
MALAAPLSLVSASSPRAFVDFDERLVSAQAGVIIVRAPVEAHGPIVAHASRRLRTSGFHFVDAAVRTGAPLFREVAMHLGLGAVPVDPAVCADAIAAAAVAQRAAIVGPLPKERTWDRAVAIELAKNTRLLLVFVTESEPRLGDPSFASADRRLLVGESQDVFDFAAELAPGDKLRWLSAVAEQAQTELPAADLRSLEAWWA